MSRPNCGADGKKIVWGPVQSRTARNPTVPQRFEIDFSMDARTPYVGKAVGSHAPSAVHLARWSRPARSGSVVGIPRLRTPAARESPPSGRLRSLRSPRCDEIARGVCIRERIAADPFGCWKLRNGHAPIAATGSKPRTFRNGRVGDG